MVKKIFQKDELVYIGIPEVWGEPTFYQGRYLFRNAGGGHTVQMADLYPIGNTEHRGGTNVAENSWWSIVGQPADNQQADVSDHYIFPYGNINTIRILYGKQWTKNNKAKAD